MKIGEQLFYVLCEKVEVPDGVALIKLSECDVCHEPIIDKEKALSLAKQYSECINVPVFILEASITAIAYKDSVVKDVEAPNFTDVTSSYYCGDCDVESKETSKG